MTSDSHHPDAPSLPSLEPFLMPHHPTPSPAYSLPPSTSNKPQQPTDQKLVSNKKPPPAQHQDELSSLCGDGPQMSPRTSIGLQQGVGNNLEDVRRITGELDRSGNASVRHPHFYEIRKGLHHLKESISESVGSVSERKNSKETSSVEDGRSEEVGEHGYDGITAKFEKLTTHGGAGGSVHEHHRHFGSGSKKTSWRHLLHLHNKDTELQEFVRSNEFLHAHSVSEETMSTVASPAGYGLNRVVTETSDDKFDWRTQSMAKNRAGAKRAVLIGIDYWDSKEDKLGGCYRDCQAVFNMLVEVYGFHAHQIVVLNDFMASFGKDCFPDCHRHEHPTRDNIMYWLSWLTKGARPGDTMFLYFGGHGDQQKCRTRCEIDGQDEVLLPVDFRVRRVSVITDDEIYDDVVKKVPRDCFLFALFDCCHSGTNMDLPYLATPEYTNRWQLIGEEYYNFRRAENAGVDYCPNTNIHHGKVISLAGTSDAGKSMEISGNTHMMSKGVMTSFFLEAIQGHKKNLTYAQLMRCLNDRLEKFLKDQKVIVEQSPALSTSHPFDLNSPFCL